MKKSVVALTLLLIASLAGTFAVYQLYVKQRMKELGENMSREELLENKIDQMQTTFFKTKPEAVLEAWRLETQPWADAVDVRSRFFNLGDISLEHTIPEERIPKFYYKEIYEKNLQELEDEAWQKGTILANTTFNIPEPSSYGSGSNPSAKEIEKHIVRWEFGAIMTRMLMDAGATSINTLNMWPQTIKYTGRSGVFNSRTVGVSMTIPIENLVKFLDRLGQEERFFQVEVIRISNSTLRSPYADISVDLILTQVNFEPSTNRRDTIGGVDSDKTASTFASLFGASSGSAAPRDTQPVFGEKELTGWRKFRKNWLPF